MSRDRSELFKESEALSHADLGGGWWTGIDMSTDHLRQVIKQVLKEAFEVAGIKLGTELALIER